MISFVWRVNSESFHEPPIVQYEIQTQTKKSTHAGSRTRDLLLFLFGRTLQYAAAQMLGGRRATSAPRKQIIEICEKSCIHTVGEICQSVLFYLLFLHGLLL